MRAEREGHPRPHAVQTESSLGPSAKRGAPGTAGESGEDRPAYRIDPGAPGSIRYAGRSSPDSPAVPGAPRFADGPSELSVWTACGRGCPSLSARIPGFVPGLIGHPLPRPPPAPPPRPHRCPGRRAGSARFHAALVPEIARTRPDDRPGHIGPWTPEYA